MECDSGIDRCCRTRSGGSFSGDDPAQNPQRDNAPAVQGMKARKEIPSSGQKRDLASRWSAWWLMFGDRTDVPTSQRIIGYSADHGANLLDAADICVTGDCE